MAAGFAMLALLAALASALLVLPFGGVVAATIGILAGMLAPMLLATLKFSRFIKHDSAMAGGTPPGGRFPAPRRGTPPQPHL